MGVLVLLYSKEAYKFIGKSMLLRWLFIAPPINKIGGDLVRLIISNIGGFIFMCFYAPPTQSLQRFVKCFLRNVLTSSITVNP